jgi:hypothetical protein
MDPVIKQDILSKSSNNYKKNKQKILEKKRTLYQAMDHSMKKELLHKKRETVIKQ